MAYIPVINQSVSGTVGASIVGLPPVNLNVGGSPVTTSNPVAVQPPASGTLPVRLGTSTDASVITVGSPVANQSVSGQVGASVVGHAPVVIVGGSVATSSPANQSVSGTVAVANFPANQSVSGAIQIAGNSPASIVAVERLDGTVGGSSLGLVTHAVLHGETTQAGGGTFLAVKVTPSGRLITESDVEGSVVALQGGTWRTSLVSTVPSSVIVGASIFGQLPAGTAPLGSVATLQGTNPWITQPTSGSVIATQSGTWSTSVMTNVITSIATAGQVMGSVATLQGTNPWIVNYQNSSILAVPVGSTIGYWDKSPSIVGTYAEDATHTTADKGLFILGVRNDAVASFTGANLEYGPQATDSAGRLMTKPFAAEEARIEGYNSVVSTSVTTLVAAAGAGLRNYITDIVLANTGATTTLVTFRSGGGTSILGYGIAPAGGGSNMIGFATPIRTLANETFDFQPTSASSILYATVKGFKAP